VNDENTAGRPHPLALNPSVFADAPEIERATLKVVATIIEVERCRLRPELGKGNYLARGFAPRADTVDTMSWEDLLLRREVIERCAVEAETKESDILRMVLSHCRPSNIDALFWMCSFYTLLDGVPEIASESATNIALTVARAQKAYFEQRDIKKHKGISKKGGDAKNAEHNRRAEGIRKAWASGKYIARSVCADEEWEGLGFESRDTARDRLKNTPDPNPWPAKQR
jgi:hypothetical protein